MFVPITRVKTKHVVIPNLANFSNAAIAPRVAGSVSFDIIQGRCREMHAWSTGLVALHQSNATMKSPFEHRVTEIPLTVLEEPTMKRSLILPAIIALAAGSVFAQVPTPAITDSVGVLSGTNPTPVNSTPAPVGGSSVVEMGTPVVSGSTGYVGDVAPTESVISSGTTGEVISGGTISGGETIAGGEVISGDGFVGGCRERSYGRPDLFYNFYTQGYCNRANAQLYLSPLPVPPNVGHTFFTYQPFYPHEYLYGHTNRFHNYYDGGRGTNRTRVNYSTEPVRTAVRSFYWNKIRIPR